MPEPKDYTRRRRRHRATSYSFVPADKKRTYRRSKKAAPLQKKNLPLLLLALFLCLLCLAGPESRGFYLSGALWGAACLITTAPPEPEEIPQEETDVPA